MATLIIENNVICIVYICEIIFVCVYECQTQQGSGQSRSPNQECIQGGGAHILLSTFPCRFCKRTKIAKERRQKERKNGRGKQSPLLLNVVYAPGPNHIDIKYSRECSNLIGGSEMLYTPKCDRE